MEKVKLNSERWLSLENLEGEEWKELIGYRNYEISNYGRIKRLAHTTTFDDKNGVRKTNHYGDKMVKLSLNKYGYVTFRPTKDKKLGQILVHRYVALAFVQNPDNLPFVNHKDECKTFNHVSNLEWCTNVYNINYGEAQKRHSESLRKTLRSRCYTVHQFDINGNIINSFKGMREIMDAGYNYFAVRNCCRHKTKTAHGYVWRRNDDAFSYEEDKRNYDCCKKIVLCYDKDMNLIAEYLGTKEALRAIGKKECLNSCISRCCNGGRPSAFGYIWRYKQ